MMQMIQQISAEQVSQAASSRSGQTAGQTVSGSSAQNADTFRAVVRAAVGSAGKDTEKAGETGGEKKDQDSEEQSAGSLPVQILFPVIVIPFPAAETGAEQQEPTVGVQTNVQTDVSAGLSPPSALASDTSVLQSLQGGEGGGLPEAVPEAVQTAGNTAASVVQTETASVTPAAETAVSVENPLPQPAAVSAEKAPEVSSSEQASISQTPVSDPVSADGRAEIRVSTENTQPQKKEETSGKDNQTAQLSDLYSDGNVVIKVSDAKTTQEPEAVRQVVQAVVQQQKQGKQEFQVELYPQNLGKVSVKLSSENGVLTVEISASNPKTQSLLLSGSDGIRSMLQSSTGKNVNVVQVEQTAGWYTPQNGENSEGGRQDQNEEKRRESGAWRRTQITGADGVGGMDTGKFLSLMQQIAQ